MDPHRTIRRVAPLWAAALLACSLTGISPAAGHASLLSPRVTNLQVPAGWVGPGTATITAEAQAPLLGIRSIELTTAASPAPSVRTYPCLPVSWSLCPARWAQTFAVASADLPEGSSEVRAIATDMLGLRSAAVVKALRVDRTAPQLDAGGELAGAANGWLADRAYDVTITARDGSPAQPRAGVRSVELLVNGARRGYGEQACAAGSCALERALSLDATWLAQGKHAVRVVATDHAANSSARSWSVGVDRTAPDLTLSGPLAGAGSSTIDEVAALHAQASDRFSGTVRLEVLLDGARKRLEDRPCPGGECSLSLDWTLEGDGLEPGPHTVAVVAEDAAGLKRRRELAFEWRPNGTPDAPRLDAAEITPFGDQTSFLYTGAHPVQTGVAAGTIQERRAAVIRGRLTDRTGAAVSGAKVTVAGHPELGETRSRDDGEIYMAANGGGLLTVHIEHDDFLPVDRQVDVPWQGWAFIDDTVLVHADPRVTAIDASGPLPALAVHRGSVERDAAGERQVTLMFPAGLEASMELPDGATRPLHDLHVRATEYTVGATGQDAMPGPLPATSAYTYAADFAIEEARAAGARHVHFSKPVIGYLENFRGAPVGARVPNGYYERSKGAWVPDSDGRVVKVLSETGAVAALDVAGTGQAASAATLGRLGIDDAELREVAALYEPGQELWRVPTRHFSDWNYGFTIVGAAQTPGSYMIKTPLDGPCTDSGSVIECESQTLGEDIALTGTGLGLHYRSDRMPGRVGEGRSIEIPLTDGEIPPGLVGVELEVEVAGRRFEWKEGRRFPAQPNMTHRFEWDGKDAFGRALQGAQRAKIRVGFVYEIVYRSDAVTDDDIRKGFGTPPEGARIFTFSTTVGGGPGGPGGGVAVAERPKVTFWQQTDTTLGGWDARTAGLGGWTLSSHHQYDPVARKLYLGNGSRQSAQSLNRVIEPFAGTGSSNGGEPSGSATGQALFGAEGMDVGPDGSVYIADFYNDVIRRVRPDGDMEIVAGRKRPSFYQPRGFGGDGGPATDADIFIPTDVDLGPDGSLYITDYGNNRVRKVDPSGTITTVAGGADPYASNAGDNGPAAGASLRQPKSTAVAPDGTLFIAERGPGRVRRVGPDGVITTYAGGGTQIADNIPATKFLFHTFFAPINGLALGPDGSLYVASDRVHRITPDGIIAAVAGNGLTRWDPAETRTVAPALDATIGARAIGVGRDGKLYVFDDAARRLWRLDGDGKLRVVAGRGLADSRAGTGDGGPASEARFDIPNGVAFGHDGSVYVSDWSQNTVRRISSTMPGFTGSDLALPSEDGSELYRFDETGRHLETVATATRAVTRRFDYGPSGLKDVADGDGNVVRMERDPDGEATAIVAPSGQRTSLDIGPDGYLAEIRDPAGRPTTMGYEPGGLLATFAAPGAGIDHIDYDSDGRLVRDENALGEHKTLTRSAGRHHYQVVVGTRLGRTRTYRVESAGADGIRRTVVGRGGATTTTTTTSDGTERGETADGSTTTSHLRGDPRFGLLAPFAADVDTRRPSGASSSTRSERAVDFGDRDDPLSARTVTDTTTVSGRVTTRRRDRDARTTTTTDPGGRSRVTTVDDMNRPVRVQAPGVAAVEYGYDERGRLKETTQGDRRWSAHYDAAGWLDATTDALDRTTRYERDVLGRVKVTTLPDGRRVGYDYDAAGNVERISAHDRPANAFAFGLTGSRVSWSAPAASGAPDVVEYRYDDDGELAKVLLPDMTRVDLTRDDGGRVTEVAHPTGTVGLRYGGAGGQLDRVTHSGGQAVTWTHDGPLPVSEVASGRVAGETRRTFDGEGRLESSTIGGDEPVTYAYAADGLLARGGALRLNRDAATGFVTSTAARRIDLDPRPRRLRLGVRVRLRAGRGVGVLRALRA